MSFPRACFPWFLTMIVLLPAACAEEKTHDKTFWRDISKNEGKLPDGSLVCDLAPELIADLASPDAELRDTLAYNILLRWIYYGTLTPDEVRPLMGTLIADLRVGIGENGTDGVLRRSYSALVLSVIVARHNERETFLTAEEHHALLDAALAYLADEKDVRGFDPKLGWVHSVAHTADLLKFLARDPRLTNADGQHILDALLAKLRVAPEAYTHGEDERLARVVIALARHDSPDRPALEKWVREIGLQATFPDDPTPETLRRTTNARHLLTGLWAEISVDERPSAGLDFLRTLTRDVLRKTI